MKYTAITSFLLGFGILLAPQYAMAQKAVDPSKVKAINPSTLPAPLPDVATPAPAPAPSTIPPLAPSRPCVAKDLSGLWKVTHVYEDPLGSETIAYASNPVQYILFQKDNVYGKFNAGRTEIAPMAAVSAIKNHSTGLMQFLVQDSGVVYFYQDKVATETQACFMVVNASGPFAANDMLMMPPKGQIKGRLIKQYRKIDTVPPHSKTPTGLRTRLHPRPGR